MKLRCFFTVFLILSLLSGCSTAGGMYKSGDSQHGEFSVVRSIFAVFGVVAVVAAASQGGGASNDNWSQNKWDYLPGSNQWACRNTYSGQFVDSDNCSGQLMVDNWP